MNMLPYLYQEAKKASDTGLPMMRALMLDYPDDERVRGLYDQYLFGESLLVAPIIEEGEVERQVYLPDGKWLDFWSGDEYEGPAVIRSVADVEQIPVFVKMNTALLLNVAETKALGSPVGNDISGYKTPVCRIYCDSSFTQTLTDHLGHVIELSVDVQAESIVIHVTTALPGMTIDVIGCDKPLTVVWDSSSKSD
ncbi:hypothetical protein [Litoribacterium kuwaitense]|uniref:hypothetical protein n=1 Tax=Litoribacterium kuwaitense TaxID=1398745 RepID=UPI0035E443B6